MRKEYLTILNEASAELEVKRSRFVASAKPVASEEEAFGFINELKSRFWNASHNVFAYYICNQTTVQKFSDDGEPSGTAGLPVLEAIKRLGVQDLAVVVTRYFGGTQLGASGLVRAYGKSAVLCIEAAKIVKKQLCRETKIILDYPLLGKVQALAASLGYIVKDSVYTDIVELYLYVPVDDFERFSGLLAEATGAKAAGIPGENAYITLEY